MAEGEALDLNGDSEKLHNMSSQASMLDVNTSSLLSVTYHVASPEVRGDFYDDSAWYVDYNKTAYQLELPQSSQIALITIFSTTALLAVVGNISVIVVLSLGTRSRTDLSKYLLNLAVADLCMACFCIPFTFTKSMLGYWVFGSVMCPVVLFIQVLSVAVSIFTNTAIGIDRFVAVLYPLKQRFTKTRTQWVILGIWVAACIIAGVQIIVGRSTEFVFDGKTYRECSEHWTYQYSRNIYTTFLLFATYVIPLVTLSCTYYKIGTTLWQRKTPGNADQARDQSQCKSKRKVTKMLALIVVVFALCWLPLHLFSLVIDLRPQVLELDTQEEERIFFGIFFFCHWLAMASSFTNPIIYCFCNHNFTVDLKQLLYNSACNRCLWRYFGGTCCQDSIQRKFSGLSTRSFLSRSFRRHSYSSTGSGKSYAVSRKIITVRRGVGEEVFMLEKGKKEQTQDLPDVVFEPRYEPDAVQL